MAAPAFVEVPGMDFDWLNLDTEQGMRIPAGRRGLTLEDINSTSYGVKDKDEAGISVFAPRGSNLDPRSPRHARQYRDKGDVWSESAMLLYEEANQRQWSSARDIPWETIKPLPDDLEWAMCTLCTFLTQVEFIAGDLPGRFMEQIHTDPGQDGRYGQRTATTTADPVRPNRTRHALVAHPPRRQRGGRQPYYQAVGNLRTNAHERLLGNDTFEVSDDFEHGLGEGFRRVHHGGAAFMPSARRLQGTGA